MLSVERKLVNKLISSHHIKIVSLVCHAISKISTTDYFMYQF